MSRRISPRCRSHWHCVAAWIALVVAAAILGACALPERASDPAVEVEPANARIPAAPPPSDDDLHHEHEAPHGGTLVELGDEFAHVELVIDAAHGRLVAYVLDGEAERSVRIAQATIGVVVEGPANIANRPLELLPSTSTLTGEKPGDASEFTFSHDALRGIAWLSGRILDVSVKGQVFHDVPFVVIASDSDEH